jgi:hypothetical protein
MSFKSMVFDATDPPESDLVNVSMVVSGNSYQTLKTFTPTVDSFLKVDIAASASDSTANVLCKCYPTVLQPGGFFDTFYLITPNGQAPAKTWMLALVAGKTYHLQVAASKNCTLSATAVSTLFVQD